MKKSYLSRYFFLFALTGIAVTGCIDSDKNLYNPDEVEKEYQDNFPVDNIDANQDWKTTRASTVNVEVKEDAGTSYKVQILTENPLVSSSNPKLLAQGYATDQMSFATTIDYPTALEMVYVARRDARGRYAVKPVIAQNNTINVTFGAVQRSSSTTTRIAENDVLQKIEDYRAVITLDELQALLDDPETLTMPVTSSWWSPDWSDRDKTFKVTASGTINISNYGLTGFYAGSRIIVTGDLIIEGGWSIVAGNSIGDGPEFIVAPGASLTFKTDNSTDLIRIYGNLTILEGGAVYIPDNILSFESTDALYNAGTLEVKYFDMSVKGQMFNYGDFKCDTYNASATGSAFINRGRAVIGEYEGNNNTILENGCYLEVLNNLRVGSVLMGDYSAIVCDKYVTDGSSSLCLTMGHMSMLDVITNMDIKTNIQGPTEEGTKCLVRPGGIESYTWTGTYAINGNVIYELTEEMVNNAAQVEYLEKYMAAGDGGGEIASPGKANIIIEEDEDGCTGSGYVPDDIEDPDPDPEVITYSYAFEDLYPDMGDYDFNDIVLDVATTYNRASDNKIESIEIDITLSAVGATKQIGAALRLKGIPQSNITSLSFEDPNNMRSTLSGSLFQEGNYESNTTSEAVIPLFGDAHKVYESQYSYTGADGRLILNTSYGNGYKITPYTMKITIVPATQSTEPLISLSNMDFFIGFAGALNKRTEVHLYEWIADATPNGEVYADGAAEVAVNGRYTWAVCVPDVFVYPQEGVTITKAYPDFAAWAADRNTNQDWYTNPVSSLVYTRE